MHLAFILVTILALLTIAGPLAAADASAALRVFPEGKCPDDRRLGALKDLDGYFPFEVPATPEAWAKRTEELHRRVQIAVGLWPMPDRPPVQATIHGHVERPGFTVEKVFFESLPGHFVSGLLFRPQGKTGRLPGVLCPHGHGGRLQDNGVAKMKDLIAKGEELFESAGRFPKVALCAQLARMGCVAFIFDMEGYADSIQTPMAIAHGFKKLRPALDTPERWAFFSTQAELRMQSIYGLQTWNALRSLDFLCGLPDVDSARIGVTGGSGGGTQTIMLGVLDTRQKVAFPQGMVSTSMQGGCPCENASLLRIGTGNVELAALFAPRPQGMTAANDWTKEMMTKGFPELKKLYAMLGAEENVICEPQLQFPHNYNAAARAVMYRWFNKHLKLGLNDEALKEGDFKILTPEEHAVWDAEHPKPEGGVDHEVNVLRAMTAESDRCMEELRPKDAAALARHREVVGGATDILIGRGLPAAGEVERNVVAKEERDGVLWIRERVRNTRYGEEIPSIRLRPKSKAWNRRVVLWLDGQGKAGLLDVDGALRPEVRKLLEAGTEVIGADLLYQGEFLADGKPMAETRVVKNPREVAAYTFGYNHSLFACRAHDILTLTAAALHADEKSERVDAVALNGAGPWLAAARAQAGNAIAHAAIDTEGFRFVTLKSWRDANFLPGAVKYGDLPGLLSLSAPHPLWLAGEDGKLPKMVEACYKTADARKVVKSSKAKGTADAAVKWLLEE
jgi:dienelactone hydrolase